MKLASLFRPVVFVCLSLACGSVALAAGPSYMSRRDIATGFTAVRGLAVADFNGDGKPDLAATDVFTRNIYTYLNDGAGGFAAPLVTPVDIGTTKGMGVLLAGDVNEDGKPDLIATSVGGDQPTYVLLGNGDGRFTQAALVPGSFTAGQLVDVNGDGHLDVVGVYLTSQAPSVAVGDGKGRFTSVSLAPASGAATTQSGLFTAIVTGDFNRDGATDLIAAYSATISSATPALYFYAGMGKNAFLAPQTIANTTTRYSHGTLAAADFDSDGKLDLLDGSAVIASIFPGYGDGTFGLGTPAYSVYFPVGKNVSDYVSVATADLTVDGFPDIVVAVPTDNKLYAFQNEGKGQFLQNTADFSASLAGRPGTLLTADLNGDGLPDIVVTDITNQNISYFLSIRPKSTPVITITSSATQVLAGSAVTVTVAVGGANAKATGGATLSENGQPAGQATLDSNGMATISLASVAAGSHTYVASYGGDATYLAGSASASLMVAATDVTVTLPAATQTIAPGGTATYSLTLAPIANFSGTVSFTCSGLPTGYACSASPVTLAGQSATATVKVVGGAASLAQPVSPFGPGSVTGTVLAALAAGCWVPLRRRRGSLLCLLAIALLSTLAGCSGGSSSSSSSTSQPVTTSPVYRGSTNFTITTTLSQGSQTLTHTSAATLVVQ